MVEKKPIVTNEFWRIVFLPKLDDVAALDEFLRSKLHKSYQHRIGHSGRVIIEGAIGKDDAWRVALWVKHNCGIGVENLRHFIVGYEGLKINYLSYCSKCRKGDQRPHYEHSEGNKEEKEA